MEQTKDELIAGLYAIRAGLSFISQENDKVKAISDTLSRDTSNKRSFEQEISSIEAEQRKLQSESKSKNWEREKILKDREEGLRNIKPIGKAVYIVPAIISVIFLIIAIAIFAALGEVATLPGNLSLVVITWIPSICIISSRRREAKEQMDKIERECETRLLEADKRYAKDLSTRKERLEKLEKELSNRKSELDRQIIKVQKSQAEYADIVPISVKKCEEMLNVLMENYSSILSVSDWANIDMLIYYLSTGRADTTKEALQLYDRQRQTDAIVRAISEAQKNICNVIQSGFVALGKAMVDCFKVLSDQLTIQHTDTMQAMGKLGQQISAQENTIAGLKNALTAKMSVSSQKLAEDMNSMQYEIRKLRGVNY